MHVVALVSDLMDRSRISAAVPGTTFVADVDTGARAITAAAIVVIDLARHGDALAAVRMGSPDAFIVAFGPHVDDEELLAARAAGADRVLPRSRFFRDPAAAVALEDEP